jgi:hypothetical protein
MAHLFIERGAIDSAAYFNASTFSGITQAEVVNELSKEFFWVEIHYL